MAATNYLTGGKCLQRRGTGQRDDSHAGQDGTQFHPVTQNGMELKTYEFFISGTFHLISSDYS